MEENWFQLCGTFCLLFIYVFIYRQYKKERSVVIYFVASASTFYFELSRRNKKERKMGDLKSSSRVSGAFEFRESFSYLSIPGPPLTQLTIGQLVDQAAEKWKNSECLYDVPKDKRLTFYQLKNEVEQLASGLLKIGLSSGDRLGIWGSNSYRWIVTFLAAAKVGIIVVPLNSGYEASELLYALNYVQVKCLVFSEEVKTRNLYKILRGAIPDMEVSFDVDRDSGPIISSTLAPHLKMVLNMGSQLLKGTRLWREVQKLGEEKAGLVKMRRVAQLVQCDDIFNIGFTSGTTGRPKGAMISHFMQINGMLRMGKQWTLTPQDRHCLTPPLCHQFGIIVGIMYPLCFGCSVVIPSSTFSPSAAIITTAKEKCTSIHGTPTMHFDMTHTPGFDRLDLTYLNGAFVAGASAPRRLLVDLKEKYAVSNVNAVYGMTEVNAVTLTRDDDPPELSLTSVGCPLENVDLKIVDDTGQIVKVGQTGEICCRTSSLMQGYWEDAEKTRKVIDSARWYHTGDAGYFLESGHLVIVGRFSDVLIRGGENIYPKEIEDFLYNNLEIAEIYVFGVFDERLGEVVAAWILPKQNSKEGVTMDTDHVRRVCEGKISRSKIPVYMKFLRSQEDFPRTPMGKVQKNVMRQQYEKELGLNQPQPNSIQLFY